MTYFGNAYQGKKVLITGHTGFKGSWLALWLTQLGAHVVGVSKDIPTDPNHFELLKLDIISETADINDYPKLLSLFQKHKPKIVFHLAAQALVKESYRSPQATFATNVLGTVNVLEACRHTPSVRAVEIITSDKAYENQQWIWGYRESDPLGGYDPYSASKGCAEIVTAAYRRSFFPLEKFAQHRVLVASCRAGNVVGGGDWAQDRLIPDLMRSTAKRKAALIRNPQATRPWQHVLEPLSGYLHLGHQLLKGKTEFAEAWNFGPGEGNHFTVANVLQEAEQLWPEITYKIKADPKHHEAQLLRLDCSKAARYLNWQSIWSKQIAFRYTFEWYQSYYQQQKILSKKQLHAYLRDAAQQHASWIKET